MLLEIIFILSSFVVLFKASNYLVDSSVKLSAYLGFPEFIIGFLVIAIGTSLPELSVSTISSIVGDPNISIGNIVGSNIVDLSFVLGISLLVYKKLKIESETLLRDIFASMLLSIGPLFLISLSTPHPLLGFFFIILFIYYLREVLKEKQLKREIEVKPKEAVFAGILIIPSLVLVLLSSYLITFFGEGLAVKFSIPSFLVGTTIIAFGTSLPELSTILMAMKKGHNYLAWGNIMGSLVTNSTLVLGVTCLFIEKHVFIKGLFPAVVLLFIFEIIIAIAAKMDREMRWVDGLSFLTAYFFYIFLEFLINV